MRQHIKRPTLKLEIVLNELLVSTRVVSDAYASSQVEVFNSMLICLAKLLVHVQHSIIIVERGTFRSKLLQM